MNEPLRETIPKSKRFIFFGKFVERGVKAWIAADGAKVGSHSGPAANYGNC